MTRLQNPGNQNVKNAATLAFLHPSFMDELRFGQFKNSLITQGSYRMNLRQPNRQPEHSREYQPGDPTRLIDWKAYAKHEQLIVRQIQDEASAKVTITIDTSKSMLWPPPELGQGQPHITKIECAVRIGFALAYAHLKVGDQASIVFSANARPMYRFKPRSSSDIIASFDRMTRAGFSPEGLFVECQAIKRWPEQVDRGYTISDLLYEQPDQIETRGLTAAKEHIVFHLLSNLETNPDWIESESFYHDSEQTSKEYQGRTLTYDSAYLKEINNWQKKLEAKYNTASSRYIHVTDQTPVSTFMYALKRV